jgi:hypothetical protein
MRQAIRDLVASVDPYVRVDAEAEDVSTSNARLHDTFILSIALIAQFFRAAWLLRIPTCVLFQMLLTVASEFLESTTNFSARLARHRGSDSLDVKDLQLHLGKFQS